MLNYSLLFISMSWLMTDALFCVRFCGMGPKLSGRKWRESIADQHQLARSCVRLSASGKSAEFSLRVVQGDGFV